MKLKDLQCGNYVQLRNGGTYFYGAYGSTLFNKNDSGVIQTVTLEEYDNDMLNQSDNSLDIMLVFSPLTDVRAKNLLNNFSLENLRPWCNILFEREREMTMQEIEQKLGHKIKIVEVEE